MDKEEVVVDEKVVVEGEETIIIIGDEKEPPRIDGDSSTIRHLRTLYKDKSKEAKQLREQLAAKEIPTLSSKPTFESCDGDPQKLEKELDEWHAKKAELDSKKAEAERQEKQRAETWQTKLNSYGDKKKALNVQDYDDVEEAVLDTLNVTQQGVLIDSTDNPAAVLYAIGKRPELLKELAGETNPVKFAAKLARLESTMTITKRKPGIPPEEVPEGSGKPKGGVDQLEKLREEAARTGDYSKVTAYKAANKK